MLISLMVQGLQTTNWTKERPASFEACRNACGSAGLSGKADDQLEVQVCFLAIASLPSSYPLFSSMRRKWRLRALMSRLSSTASRASLSFRMCPLTKLLSICPHRPDGPRPGGELAASPFSRARA